MAGNTLVLKHASNVPESALAIEQLMKDAGFPENVFRTLLVPGNETEAIILNPHIKGVTLTGSTPAGKKVAASAGSVLKKLVLELGGSDPYIILEDADVAQAATACATSRLINTGQSCIAAKRFIVVESIFDVFVEKFVDEMSKATMGDPTTDVTIGPMARVDLRDELHQQVVDSVTAGAEIALGGVKPEGRGAYYPVTVLTNVKKGMPAYDDELFGPVASVIKVKDEEEAIRVANDSIFGLGGAVFTRDLAKGVRIAKEEIQAGAVFVNNFVISDPRVPFGGIKESGYGRELGSLGIKEFTNPKTVQIA
jgi:succinate-semialdehyde dehydrogenase/glutarate-semialdehyde dehydrogenase